MHLKLSSCFSSSRCTTGFICVVLLPESSNLVGCNHFFSSQEAFVFGSSYPNEASFNYGLPRQLWLLEALLFRYLCTALMLYSLWIFSIILDNMDFHSEFLSPTRHWFIFNSSNWNFLQILSGILLPHVTLFLRFSEISWYGWLVWIGGSCNKSPNIMIHLFKTIFSIQRFQT